MPEECLNETIEETPYGELTYNTAINAINRYASQFYPPEFVEWIGGETDEGRICYFWAKSLRPWLFDVTRQYLTTAELFDYWKTNIIEK